MIERDILRAKGWLIRSQAGVLVIPLEYETSFVVGL